MAVLKFPCPVPVIPYGDSRNPIVRSSRARDRALENPGCSTVSCVFTIDSGLFWRWRWPCMPSRDRARSVHRKEVQAAVTDSRNPRCNSAASAHPRPSSRTGLIPHLPRHPSRPADTPLSRREPLSPQELGSHFPLQGGPPASRVRLRLQVLTHARGPGRGRWAKALRKMGGELVG